MKSNFILFFLIFGTLTLSQEREHQISVGYTLGNTSQFLDAFREISYAVGGGLIFSESDLKNEKNKGGIHFSYAYTPQKSWFFGATFVYTGSEYDLIVDGQNYGKQSYNYYTFAGEAGFHYLKREYFRLYSLVGLGLTFIDSKFTERNSLEEFGGNQSMVDFQVTPLGISFGKKFGGFANFGFGYRGLVNFGLYYRL